MKRLVFVMILLGSVYSFGADWHYDEDGCTKVYQYGRDSSECFDKRRIELGRYFYCKLTGRC